MHTFRDDYLINTLRFVFAKEETQIYGAILPESLTSPEIKETKAYKTYVGFATGATPPKKAQKFKKPASPKLTTVPVSTEERTRKSKRLKRPAKKYTKAPARGVVIRETPEMHLSLEGSVYDFHKTHTSGSGAVKIYHSVTVKGTGLNQRIWMNAEEEIERTNYSKPSNDFDDEDETKITDKAKCNEDEEIYYTTSQLYDDVDIRLNKPVDLDKGFVQEEGFDAAMTNKIVVPVTSSSHSSDLAAKFLNFSDIPHTYAEIVSLMDVHVHHEVLSQKTPTLLTVPVSVISDSSLVFSTRSRKDKDKDEDPSIGSDRGLKKRKSSKDAEPTKGPKAKESQSGSSKGTKSQSKSFRNKIDEEPKEKVASKCDWFTKPTQPQEPTDPDWNVDKTPQQGQNQSWLMTLASSVEKLSKMFDELMSTPIDFSAFIMNGLKINNLTQETLLGPAFRLLKGTRSNYAELNMILKNVTRPFQKNLIGKIRRR
ncbi:hypothetical protein Tco_0194500 [Tanacetum coccineum]